MLENDPVRALENFGKIRRQINLVAVKLLKDHRLHPKQMVMLRFVNRHGKVTLTQLAAGTATDMAAASRAIGPLIKQGWLKKARDPKDGRCWIIQLTPRAARKMPGIERVYSGLAKMFYAPLNEREGRDFLRLLTKVSERLQSALD